MDNAALATGSVGGWLAVGANSVSIIGRGSGSTAALDDPCATLATGSAGGWLAGGNAGGANRVSIIGRGSG